MTTATPETEATTHGTEAEGGAHGGAFPPLDPQHFPSQLLWLAIAFGLLYLLMSRVALPRVGAMLEARRSRISGDLARAKALKEETEAVIADYEAKLARYSTSGKFADKPLDPQTPMIESAIYSVVLNPTWSVPANIVSKVAADLMEFGAVQRAYIGVSIADVDPALAKEIGLERPKGVYVKGLTDGGAAAVEGVHRHGEALTHLAHAMGVGHPHLVEADDTRGRPLDAQLVFELLHLHAPAGLDEKAGDAGGVTVVDLNAEGEIFGFVHRHLVGSWCEHERPDRGLRVGHAPA